MSNKDLHGKIAGGATFWVAPLPCSGTRAPRSAVVAVCDGRPGASSDTVT